ncbi:substrate-binding domain-containing protein [uncultured Ruminococcus sp.]|uniref:substrate-binding domain-containing protein n=1 Tax=uncultured Ruminococcus sp. TaxID=165186 RepID=UPI0025E23567|nr:substrate-binding domain-containing protein [uncultured Ruminococcus sp.]
MVRKKRMMIGIVTAEANSIEQRQIIKGIARFNQCVGVDTIVFSNNYNPNIREKELFCENKVYDLILSDELDGLIVISESFVNEDLKKLIADLLMRKSVPIVIVGTHVKELDFPQCTFINTSDENDIEDLTDHLVEKHGFKEIDILTGYDFIEASGMRVNGYRKSLEKHGIEYDEKRVHYGNYWMNSGAELAERYYSGELRLPQAIVCANDYMAYGLIDKFDELEIKVPEDVTVVGYEYVGDRFMHTPVLTTYKRNRETIGEDAANMVYSRIKNREFLFAPPKGEIICGTSCTCGADRRFYAGELKNARAKKDYDNWNLFNPLDQKLTECRTLSEFTDICGTFHWQVRGIQSFYLCLYKNWYDSDAELSDILSCQSMVNWEDRTPFDMQRYNFSALLARNYEPAIYYFNPLFFNDRLFGYLVLKYHDPDTYDDIYRNWLKSVSNGLEFLRMKNDIQYLTQCQNLSDLRDTLTGMYNETGMRKAYHTLDITKQEFTLVMMRIGISNAGFYELNGKIPAIMDAAEAVKQFCGSNDICGRVNDNTFACLIQGEMDIGLLENRLSSIMLQHNVYLEQYGLDSFVIAALKCTEKSYTRTIGTCSDILAQRQCEQMEMRMRPHYEDMLSIRSYIYSNPQDSFESDKLQKLYPYSAGHLREVYKKCFGVSIHKDCINARMAKATYCLMVTPLSMTEIAEQCGYVDSKYFLRQFLATVGVTPNQYRNMTK